MKSKFILLLLALLSAISVVFGQKITVTDIVGREVTLKKPAQRVILGEGRSMITLSLLYENPAEVVVGWMSDFKKHGGLLYDEYVKKFPEITQIRSIGAMGQETVSTEQIVALRPDLAIFSSGSHGPNARSANTIRQLEAAGIPIVFIDFRLHPIENTAPSMELLGKVLGKEREAAEFIRFYQQKMDYIEKNRPRKSSDIKPKVYMEMIRGKLSGTPGKGNLGEYIEWLGGRNIGDVLPGEVGELNAEYVIAQQPDIYIVTGLAEPGEVGFVIGPGIRSDQTRASLQNLAARSLIQPLSAVRTGRVYGLWHFFYDSPLNIVAIEALARWIQPKVFGDLDPGKTIDRLNADFLALPLKGEFFIGLTK